MVEDVFLTLSRFLLLLRRSVVGIHGKIHLVDVLRHLGLYYGVPRGKVYLHISFFPRATLSFFRMVMWLMRDSVETADLQQGSVPFRMSPDIKMKSHMTQKDGGVASFTIQVTMRKDGGDAG